MNNTMREILKEATESCTQPLTADQQANALRELEMPATQREAILLSALRIACERLEATTNQMQRINQACAISKQSPIISKASLAREILGITMNIPPAIPTPSEGAET